jgi:hypothetical protein
MNVLLLRWDTKPYKRIRRTFPHPDRHAERLSMPPLVRPATAEFRTSGAANDSSKRPGDVDGRCASGSPCGFNLAALLYTHDAESGQPEG